MIIAAPLPPDLAADVLAVQGIDGVRTMLAEVCKITGMGFAAVARVTDTRWIACQVQDDIGFGLEPGEGLEVRTTICDEIRDSGLSVYIDCVRDEPAWRAHPTPIMYGFQSYISVPIMRADGSFFGTLCAIDPEPRPVSLTNMVARIEQFAASIARELDATIGYAV
ncbi:GAF domain-containing protein [Sphingomonas sp. ERG5]|uniref:GAF domain-containing protein n=1 Tax=Sphingomonas sp. ERG5 TaxID=1381597 RepID=UPI00054B0FAC|nr:GAF domain-containing protein [Sphingomonas sp. ERG5]